MFRNIKNGEKVNGVRVLYDTGTYRNIGIDSGKIRGEIKKREEKPSYVREMEIQKIKEDLYNKMKAEYKLLQEQR